MTPADPPGPHRTAWLSRPKVLAALAAAAVLVLIAVIITALAGGSGTRTPSHPAQAAAPVATSSTPAALPVVYPQVEGWRGGQVRPGVIYVGEGGSPYATALKWPSWTATGAQADGYLHIQKPGCPLPTYQCPYQRFRVQIQLSRVEAHDSVRYYSRMRWTYSKTHVLHVMRWKAYKGFWRIDGH